MFRQVHVHQEDWNYQRIIWRDSPNEPMTEYFITCIAWGTTSASWNAVRALRQCAIDETAAFPKASNKALSDFYYDDLWTGVETDDEAVETYHQLNGLLARGGFSLAKWATNSNALANIINQGVHAAVTIPDETGILGMIWTPTTDELRFKVQPLHSTSSTTKREIIGKIAQIYDPSGVIAPIVVVGKVIIQDLWRSGIDWDDTIPDGIASKWLTFCNDINLLNKIRIPRWIGASSDDTLELHVHVFADASEEAYGAVAYLRVLHEDDKITANIISAKSRVAPLKKITIPRLELLAALMAAKLAAYVIEACRLNSIKTFLWSDSSIGIYWIKRDPNQNKPFVANHVASILEHSVNAVWRHIAGTDNPADLVSRGTSVDRLAGSPIWWHGPTWLTLPAEQWPEPIVQTLTPEDQTTITAEIKSKIVAVTTMGVSNVLSITENGNAVPIIERRSTLGSILRVTALVQRFVNNIRRNLASNCRTRNKRARRTMKSQTTPISTAERDHALMYWLRVTQLMAYRKELEACHAKKILPNSSNILKLMPTMDNQGVLRVGGRLKNASIPENAKHPIIIPSTSRLTMLLIQNAHLITLHGGPQIMMNYLRQKFWTPKIRQTIQTQIHRCATCIRHRQQPSDQLMANLPGVRVTQHEPFGHTGLDFAGPFLIRRQAGRPPTERNLTRTKKEIHAATPTLKAWVIVFTCLATRAVHLDVTVGLKTEEFLAAFARFVNRKGRCFLLISDNGTSFVGADNELSRALAEWATNTPNEQLAKYQTEWKFICPASPHMGGVWESMVRRLKYHMKRVIGDRLLTRDELYTTITQIEGCLNSRTWADDPNDLSPVTPAHLLLGKPILPQLLTGDLYDSPDNRLTVWGRQQKLLQQFWKRWHEEYLTGLQQRQKWYTEKRNVQIGDMAIIKDENLTPASWAIGRITQTHPSADGLVRSVTIKTETAELSRPIQKLCLLPPSDAESSNELTEESPK